MYQLNDIAQSDSYHFHCKIAAIYIPPPPDDVSHDTTALCQTEEDSVWGIQWLAIAAGSIRSARCPGEGNTPEQSLAYRRCLNEMPAEWSSVDASKCESVAGRAVRMKVYRTEYTITHS